VRSAAAAAARCAGVPEAGRRQHQGCPASSQRTACQASVPTARAQLKRSPRVHPARPQARQAKRVSDALACPCVTDLKRGPCGTPFVAAFSCFHLSTAEPRGCDCLAANLAFAVRRAGGRGRIEGVEGMERSVGPRGGRRRGSQELDAYSDHGLAAAAPRTPAGLPTSPPRRDGRQRRAQQPGRRRRQAQRRRRSTPGRRPRSPSVLSCVHAPDRPFTLPGGRRRPELWLGASWQLQPPTCGVRRWAGR
jgi:hypothetical protein